MKSKNNLNNGFNGEAELLIVPGVSEEDRILRSIYASARNCYDPSGPKHFWDLAGEMLKNKTEKNKLIDFALNLVKNKHRTTLTHTMFSFSIIGASRACVDQMTRAQVGANFDVMSQRYIKFNRNDKTLNMPWLSHLEEGEEYTNSFSPELKEKLKNHLELTKDIYCQMNKEGKAAEECRWILPMDMKTNFMASYNIVSFGHLINTRMKHSTGKAQAEIEDLASTMLEELLVHVPFLESVYKNG